MGYYLTIGNITVRLKHKHMWTVGDMMLPTDQEEAWNRRSKMKALTSDANRIHRYNDESLPKKCQLLKRSRQKVAILRVLRNTKSHPTATWIYDEVRKEIPSISLATVYRNLRLLQTRGEISGLDIAGDCKRFESNTHHHYHGKCDRCGQIFDIDESAGKRLELEIMQKTDFTISEYRLEFRGLCRNCREK